MRITLLVIFLSFTNFIYSPIDNEYVPRNCITSRADELPLNCYAQELEKCSPSTNTEVNHLLQKYFIDCDVVNTMWLIAQAEAKGHPSVIGYNCYYIKDVVYETRVNGAISKSCKSGHEGYAWSYDVGYFQINTASSDKSIDELQDLETNFKEAQKIKKTQGYNAWWTYKNGLHLSYLK